MGLHDGDGGDVNTASGDAVADTPTLYSAGRDQAPVVLTNSDKGRAHYCCRYHRDTAAHSLYDGPPAIEKVVGL
ncbi:hypothetical protein PG988_007948 [Apiospora saccharicola]